LELKKLECVLFKGNLWIKVGFAMKKEEENAPPGPTPKKKIVTD